MNELEFTTEVASWINLILSQNPSLPFSGAKCEMRKKGALQRRDLTLLDKDKRIVLTGEVKLPYQKDGGSPYNASVVQDARKKAKQAPAPYFFTWNVNEFVLWESSPTITKLQEHDFKSWEVASVHNEGQLELPTTEQIVKTWLFQLLREFAQIVRGTSKIGHKSPDEKFIEMLESSLRMPILLTVEALDALYKTSHVKSKLDKWMRDEQGWVIYSDPEGIRDNLERTAKFSCYTLVNKLVFYEALLKRYGSKLDKLCIPEHINKGENLRLHLEGYFAEAKKVTNDYETVFGEEHALIGNRIPFYSDSAVPHWRDLIDRIHEFDFSKLDYEVIGNIFERLISPEERHKYGQFYTRVEVVDLINSFSIRKGDEKIMDPACGGGTFLVRAYVRKRELDPTRKHHELLADLYGVDISHFAAHLTTINLATRNLVDDENYPQIARSDFFDIKSHTAFIKLPKRVSAKGLGKIQHRDVEIDELDAVVGNPPYVRQEDIPRSNGKGKSEFKRGTKEYLLKLIKEESKSRFSGRSDLHCYFWPHAATFLKDDGHLCFLTSSQWLDVDYGFSLQEWILRNFEVVAILESIDEPWFVGARVVTTITVLRRQKDEQKRFDNIVRFIQLRRPIREILAHDGTAVGAIEAADRFRDELLSLDNNTANDRYRARLLKQGALWQEGVRLGQIMSKSEKDEEEDDDAVAHEGEYYGGKWGIYLRAPDLWFDLLDKYGSHFAPLGDIADLKRGITSGKDSFFMPKDYTKEALDGCIDAAEFKNIYGVSRKKVEAGNIKLVRCGEGYGEIKPIEAKYLEPEVHSLMEVDKYSVEPENCGHLILLVGKSKEDLKGTHVLDYIKWGEKRNYHRGATCAARVTEDRDWYDLTGHDRGSMFWPKAQQYKHIIPINEKMLQCNCNLYDVHLPSGIDQGVLAGILNSSIVILSKYQYGRPVGVEGNLKTEVVDVNMMLVPDPRSADKKVRSRITEAFKKMKNRNGLQLLSERRLREMAYKNQGREQELKTLPDLSELDMQDRRELDDAVLEMIGVNSPKRRKEILDDLYAYLHEYFEYTRLKEEKAIANKKRSKRKVTAGPRDIALQIYKDVVEEHKHLLKNYTDFIDKTKPFDTQEIPVEGTPVIYSDLIDGDGVEFRKGKKRVAFLSTESSAQNELIVLLVGSGMRGFVRLPHGEDECAELIKKYHRFVTERDQIIRNMIEERTSDELMQEKVYESILPLILQGDAENHE